MQLVLSIILFSVFIHVQSYLSNNNGFADPSLDFPFVRVFMEHKNRDLLIKFLNDMIEPNDNEEILEIEKGPTLYPAVKAARRLTVFDVSCKSKSGTIIVQVQLKHVNFFFEKEAQTDIVWKYYKESELIQNSYNARPVRLLIVCKASKQEIFSLETKFPVMKKALDMLLMNDWDEGEYRYHDYLVDRQLRDVLRDDAEQRSKEVEIPKLKNKIMELEKQLGEVGKSVDSDRETMKIKRQILDSKRKISDYEEWLERVKADAEIQKKYAAYELERNKTDAKEAKGAVTRAMGVNMSEDVHKSIGRLKETKRNITTVGEVRKDMTVLKDAKNGTVNAKEASEDVKEVGATNKDVIKAKEAEEIAKFEGIEKKLLMIQQMIKEREKWFTDIDAKEKTGDIENKEKIADVKNVKVSATKVKRTEIDGTKVKKPKDITNTNMTIDVVKKVKEVKTNIIEAGEARELSEREKEIAEIENVEKKLLMIRNMIAEREKWITEMENKEKLREIENKKKKQKNEEGNKARARVTKAERAEEDVRKVKESNEIAKTAETPETAAVSYLDKEIDDSEKEIAAIQKMLADHGNKIMEFTNQDILNFKQDKENVSNAKAGINNDVDTVDIAMREKKIADFEKKLEMVQKMIADREMEIAKAQNEEITRAENAKEVKVKKDKENVEKAKRVKSETRK